jgi:hypothetical protein
MAKPAETILSVGETGSRRRIILIFSCSDWDPPCKAESNITTSWTLGSFTWP